MRPTIGIAFIVMLLAIVTLLFMNFIFGVVSTYHVTTQISTTQGPNITQYGVEGDGTSTTKDNLHVVPETPLGVIGSLAAMTAAAIFFASRRKP